MPLVAYPCAPDRTLSFLYPIPSIHLSSTQSYAAQNAHYQIPKPSKILLASSQIIPDPLHPKSCKTLGYSSSKNLQNHNHFSTEETSKYRPCKFFATCSPGLEEVVAAELASPLVGASWIKEGSGGVNFEGTIATGYKANLWLRCAIRVLLELGHAEMSNRDRDPVYSFVRNAVDWPQYLASSSLKKSGLKAWKFRSFAVQSRVWDCTRVTNSMAASTRAKDAICDALRNACNNRRPEPPEGGGAMADVPLFLSLYRDSATIYRDMSGISLHRRGYRAAMHKASLSEAVAAGILTLAGWNTRVQGLGYANKNGNLRSLENMVLLDPMCGSGTFLIEAALMAANKAPGMMRTTWPFKLWHDFNPVMWRECCENAASAETEMPKGLRILGNDKHEGALSLCARDAEAAGIKYTLELSCKDCREYIPSVTPSLVVVNPPWGYRLGNAGENDDEDVESTWQALGQFSKQHCNCADMYILSGRSTVTRELRMKADKKWPITMGGIDCRLLHYYVLPPKVGINTDYEQVSEVKKAIAR
ncbi:uncharacterized protein LOC131029920 [Cryptomeria japonica]|uniref:uncharacterized protein LOC131029920 n=1 Tax=Cryptomeria japonica TaxID=3369 RepID=UPI0027DA91E5|nr:uncharacterized protein LOC131029920 [Cryptomeria japonica]